MEEDKRRNYSAKRYYELTEAERKRKYNLSIISDEQIEEIMNEILDSDDESVYEDDEDIVAYPDYNYKVDVLTPEDDTMNSKLLCGDDIALVHAVSLSLNLSNISEGLLEISEPPVNITTPEMATTRTPALPEVATAETPMPEASTAEKETAIEASTPPIAITPTEPIASTSTQVPTTRATFKPAKRPRSPLPTIEATGPRIVPSAGGFTGTALDAIDKKSAEFTSIVWRKRSMQLHVNKVAFRGKTALPYTVKNLNSPMEYFCYFFTDELIDLIVLETNRNARKENINTQFNVDAVQIRRYIGILLFMAIAFEFRQIPDCMALKKFEKIKKYLCFSNEAERAKKGQHGYDPLFRISKVANILNERYDSVPKNARLCVDEQMCLTKIVHHLRQYMPNKPHKWGIKLFVLCDTNGYSYQFEIYNGAGDNIIIPGTPDLGATSNIVIRLSQTIPNFKNHILYFDNFYTSLPLLVYLRARGIFSLGTIRANRIPNCKLPLDTDREIKDAERGHAVEYMGCVYGIDLTTILWKDTKNVRLCSTYVGIQPFQKSNPDTKVVKTPRYDKNKKYIEIDYPQIIREYNSHMGGVDLKDSYMGRRGLRIKTMDPITRIFYHFLDMAVTTIGLITQIDRIL